MILGRKPVMERQTTVRGPGPLTHTAWICIIYAVHSQRQTCKESPGARFSPDSAKQEPGGVHSGRLHCRCKARLSRAQLRPLPALSPHQPSLPLTASTAPSDICRCVFTTSKGRVRVAATWSGGGSHHGVKEECAGGERKWLWVKRKENMAPRTAQSELRTAQMEHSK